MKRKKILGSIFCFCIVCSCILALMFLKTDIQNKNISVKGFPSVYPEDTIEIISDEEIHHKVEAILNAMQEKEMYALLGGSDSKSSTYGMGTGYVRGVPRLGIPVLRFWDGPKGVIGDGDTETTSPASGLAIGSTFSRDLAYRYGQLHGSENKALGGNAQLGLQVDVVQSPYFTRSRDSLSEDQYLTGILGTSIAQGIESQQVLAVAKHLAVYSTMFGFDNYMVIDEQTLHEIYLEPFRMLVEADAAHGIMSGYNYVNSIATSAHPYLQIDVLRSMWNYQGITITDWGGNHELSTHKGTDLETPRINHNNQADIENAIASGEMSWDDVETAVRHTLTMYGKLGYLGLVQVDENGNIFEDPNPPKAIEMSILDEEQHQRLLDINDAVALETAVKGAVLLKNELGADGERVLPLSDHENLALIGLSGQYTIAGHNMESSFGSLQHMSNPYTHLKEFLQDSATIQAEVGIDIIGADIPLEYLYTNKSLAIHGILMETNEENVLLNSLSLTTGTNHEDIRGINRTYKNAEDGNALLKGTQATLTTYLVPPESGIYEFKLLGIGGDRSVKITGKDVYEQFTPRTENWGKTSVICTAEGMDIPDESISLTLEAGEVYKIVVTATAASDSKDMQVKLTWFPPGYQEQNLYQAVQSVAGSDKVILFLHDLGGGPPGFTSHDHRESFSLPEEQLDLLRQVVEESKAHQIPVIAVLNIGLPITMEWLDDVDAVLNMWLPGQAGGKATAQLLTGKQNPSGKLSVTFPAAEQDTQFQGEFYTDNTNLTISEGIFNGYRWYNQQGIEPLFSFGYGLSYTTFSYSGLSINNIGDNDAFLEISFTVTNTGNRIGTEIAQIYVGACEVPDYVQMAELQLVQFERLEDMTPGESRDVTLTVSRHSLSYWDILSESDTIQEKWVLAKGDRMLYVGSSSDQMHLSHKIHIK